MYVWKTAGPIFIKFYICNFLCGFSSPFNFSPHQTVFQSTSDSINTKLFLFFSACVTGARLAFINMMVKQNNLLNLIIGCLYVTFFGLHDSVILMTTIRSVRAKEIAMQQRFSLHVMGSHYVLHRNNDHHQVRKS
jgi:hypothetical protein